MKICKNCFIFYEQMMLSCQRCHGALEEVSFEEAVKLTQQTSLRKQIGGKDPDLLTDAQIQYHVRCYLKNRSLFLDFDLHKNRLKHGRRLKKFFISPLSISGVINLPWFLFNIINTNLFHLQYTEYCPRCNAKYIKGQHTSAECDYNIEYFNILEDIITGKISIRKPLYEHYAKERRGKGLRSAYDDLFRRRIHWEAFWDLSSVTLTVFFWLYVAVYISWPMFQVFTQQLQSVEASQWQFLSLR